MGVSVVQFKFFLLTCCILVIYLKTCKTKQPNLCCMLCRHSYIGNNFLIFHDLVLFLLILVSHFCRGCFVSLCHKK